MKHEIMCCTIKDCPLLPRVFKSGTQFGVCREENCVAFDNGKCKQFNNSVFYLKKVEVHEDFSLYNYPNCNSCKNIKSDECPYKPKWGEEVIYNCYKFN